MDSPYYMKLDNDIIIHRKDFLEHLFALVSCVEPMATFAPDFPMYMKNKNIKRVRTPHGVLGVCTSNLQGCALLIPKTVSDVLGYFNEDYGLYGADDGDYGYRMQCVGLPQYYYCKASYLTHEGSFDSSEYVGFGLDKGKEHQNLFVDENNGIGLFKINSFLFFYCLREYRVDERYEITKRDGYYIEVSEKK